MTIVTLRGVRVKMVNNNNAEADNNPFRVR